MVLVSRFARSAALRAGGLDPRLNRGKRRFAGAGRFISFNLGQHDRKLLFGNGRRSRIVRQWTIGNRFSPIALTGEQPVAQPIRDCRFPAFSTAPQAAVIFFFASAVGNPSRSPELTADPFLDKGGIGQRRFPSTGLHDLDNRAD